MGKASTILGLLALVGAAFAVPGNAVRGDAPDERTWLAAHNAERAEFGVAPLTWNTHLASEARDYARQLARSERLRHSSREDRNGTGENLWMGSAGRYAPADMIEAFASEKRFFRAGNFPRVSTTGNWADVGHYTQIVWEGTREVGCATARGERFDVLVCRYWPAGNVMGQRIEPRRRVAQR